MLVADVVIEMLCETNRNGQSWKVMDSIRRVEGWAALAFSLQSIVAVIMSKCTRSSHPITRLQDTVWKMAQVARDDEPFSD